MRPKTTCLLSSIFKFGDRVKKNWLPFVSGPSLAIDSSPEKIKESLVGTVPEDGEHLYYWKFGD